MAISTIQNDTRMVNAENAISGLDTRMSEAEEDVTRVENELNTAISAVTTDTEVTNIRVGFDGTTYSTAGDAVRGQIEEVYDTLIQAKDTQPSELHNELWIDTDSTEEVEVPTFDEFEDIITSTFSTSTAYAAGDYVIYEGVLYRFNTAHSAGVWDSSQVTLVKVCSEISDLKSAINVINNLQGKEVNNSSSLWEQGRYIVAVGELLEPAYSTTRIRTKIIDLGDAESFTITPLNGYKYAIIVLDEDNLITRYSSSWQTGVVNIIPSNNEKGVALNVAKSDDADVTPSDYNNISIKLNSVFLSDYNETKQTAEDADTLSKKFNHIALPNDARINITDTTVVIPSLTRIYYGNGVTYRTSGATTISRVATPDGGYSEELVTFDYSTSTFRCVGGNAFNTLSDTEIVLFVQSKGHNGCELPPSMYQYNGNEVYAKQQTGINEYNDIVEYKDFLENACNVAKGDTATAPKNRSNLLSLLYFSDIHGQDENIQRILQFAETYDYYIFSTIHCGDSVVRNYEDANPFASYGGNEIMNVIGNHDAWKTGATWPTPYNATEAECYTKFISPYISSWNVQSAGTNLCYYYKDYTMNGYRLIVLDSVHWNNVQKTWLTNTLASAKTAGLAVVIASHYPPQSGITGFDCTFNSLMQTIPSEEQGVNQMERLPDEAYDVVDDFITNGGEFVCWLNGHTHDDYIGVVTNHTNQIAVVISCATTSNQYCDCARHNGTKTRDLFNVFTADKSAKLIKFVRVGSDMDKFMRSRKTLCINYDTKQIISNN